MRRKWAAFIALNLFLNCINLISTESANAATGDSDTYLNLESNSGTPVKYAIAGADAAFHIDNAITLEAWVYPTSDCVATTHCHLIRKENEYALEIGSGTFRYAFNGAAGGWGWTDTGIKPVLNQWQHVAVTRVASSATVDFYLNSRSLFSGSSGAISTNAFANSSFNFQVGAMTDNVNNTNQAPIYTLIGSIDEVKVWQTARTQAQVQSDMNSYGPTNDSNLKLYYDFNDVSGSTLINKASGATSSTNLILKNSPTFPTIETTTTSAGNKVVTFPRTYLSANGWKAPLGINSITALVVGGGGGAGFNSGGGGSGGAVVSTTISYDGTGLFPIVGAGGYRNSGGVFPSASTANGDTSTINGVNAAGGNSGSNYRSPDYSPAPGGVSANGYGTGGQGSTSGANASAGSAGFSSSITGTATFYGGGGGGGGWAGSRTGGAGGNGGGGAGNTNGDGTSGTKNTGGGGGSNSSSLNIPGSGGSGVIILSFNSSSGVASAITNANYRTNSTLSVTVSEAGKVSFYAKGVLIAGCKNKATTAVSPFTASCTWKPSQRGNVLVSARFTPNSSPSYPSTIPVGTVFITARSGSR